MYELLVAIMHMRAPAAIQPPPCMHAAPAMHAARSTSPMVALARGLGAACRTSVARLRPAESDVRGMSSTRSKMVGAVRQVRGGAEAGF